MAELRSDDGRYLAAQQGDGNFVFYDTSTDPWTVVADRWSYEAGRVEPEPAPPRPTPDPEVLPGKQAIRVTGPADGELLNRGYSYWSQVFALSSSRAIAFCGHADGHPRFFDVYAHGQVQNLGSLVPYTGTGEGWYFDRQGRVYLTDGPRLRRYNITTKQDEVVFDVSESFPGCTIWQTHSSDDGRTHSMTIRRPRGDEAAEKLGTAVYRDGALLVSKEPILGELDESAISGNGRYLIIKEGEDDDNRIIDLEHETEYIMRKAEGALGHSDCGRDWVIGDDRTQGAATWINLANPDERRVLTHFPYWNPGHFSVKAERCLLTHDPYIGWLDVTTGDVQIVQRHGMVSDGTYDTQVFASLDPTGRAAAYMSNAAGRLDLYVLFLG
jgi:hypothetical protein